MKTTELKMLKVRAWQLSNGEWLVLLFIRRADDRLELLSEEYAPDEEGVKEALRVAQERLSAASREAGFPDVKVYAEFAGAKKA